MSPRKPQFLAVGVALALGAIACVTWLARAAEETTAAAMGTSTSGAASPTEAAAPLHAVQVRPGPETPRVLATLPQTGGVPSMVSCSTCHATRKPDTTQSSGAALDEFHQGLRYQHGGLSCLSCHNAGNYDTLRRADGTALEYPQAIQLCAQCHGPQYRDYLNGSHGGMTGHWDLRSGPRLRNTCTDCHDAHAPAYPQVQPVFAPQDRGARQQRERAAAASTHGSPHGTAH